MTPAACPTLSPAGSASISAASNEAATDLAALSPSSDMPGSIQTMLQDMVYIKDSSTTADSRACPSAG